MDRQDDVRATRRALLCAACVAPVVAACGGTDAAAGGAPGPGTPPESGAPAPTAGSSATGTATPGSAPSSSPAPVRSSGGGPAPAAPTTTSAGGSTSTSATPTPRPTVETKPPGALVRVSEVPVGGGVVLSGKSIVVTQPTAGAFRGFSSTCTHQGCPVSKVSGGNIICPCHGSQFSIVDGSVTRKPATTPLSTRAVVVRSGWVCTA